MQHPYEGKAMAPPKKYEKIDFTPPQGVQSAAERGLEQRRKYGRGGLTTAEAGKQGIGSGVARAATLAAGKDISPETAKRMKAFFDRHGNAPQAKPADGGPSARAIAINLWGGRAGEAWSSKLVRQMEAADKKGKK
jgi:hypothetical protein